MANVLGELFGNIADAIREKTGDTATMKPAEFPAKISGIEVGGGGGGSLPAGLYFQVIGNLKRPNNYAQKWRQLNGKTYAFVNNTSGSSYFKNIYELNETSATQVVSSTLTANWSDASSLCILEYNGKLHITGYGSNKHFVFDGGTLTACATIPSNTQQEALFVQNGLLKVYCQSNKTVYVWDETNDAWTAEAILAPINSACRFFAVANGSVFATSGKLIYSYENATLTQVVDTGEYIETAFSHGDCVYYVHYRSSLPYIVKKYSAATNVNTVIGYVTASVGSFRFWEYDGKLAALYNCGTCSATPMFIHEIEAVE